MSPRNINTSLRIKAVRVDPAIVAPPCGHETTICRGTLQYGHRVQCAMPKGKESECWVGPQKANRAKAIEAWNQAMRGGAA